MTQTSTPDISFVFPIYNEEQNIPVLYERLKSILNQYFKSYEIILVNDGSIDNSLSLIKDICSKEPHFKYISFSRNFGHQKALLAGIHHARGKSVIMMDSDLQDPPEVVYQMYMKLSEGYDMVYARRTVRKGETFMKKFTAKLFYRTLKSLSNVDIPLDTGDFRIMSRKMVDAFKMMKEKNLFLRGQFAWLGFKTTFITYERDPRLAGTTKYTWKKMFLLALNGITGFSDFPLRIASFLGVVFSLIAFFIIMFTLYSKIFKNEDLIKGWASLMVSVLFVGGIQLLCIGIIGEYISKITMEVKNRPDYIIDETNLQI